MEDWDHLLPTYGGSGVVATELGWNWHSAVRNSFHLLRATHPAPGRTAEYSLSRSRSVALPIIRLSAYDLALATRMAEVSQLYDLDLLHVHYAIPHSVSALLARQMLADGPRGRRLPFVTTLHGTDITLVGWTDPTAHHSLLINQSDGVTAISNYLRDRTMRVFDVNKEIEVIYNSVNCDVYCRCKNSSELRVEYAPKDERLLVHLSNFRPVKRVTDVSRFLIGCASKSPQSYC